MKCRPVNAIVHINVGQHSIFDIPISTLLSILINVFPQFMFELINKENICTPI